MSAATLDRLQKKYYQEDYNTMKRYMEDVSVEDARGGGCSFADPTSQEPVPGWAAVETDMGYRVYACPEFVRETWGCGRYRTAEDYILALQIALTDRNTQLQNLKKTIWWKVVYNLRSQNRQNSLRHKKTVNELTAKNRQLKYELDVELWRATVHMSD